MYTPYLELVREYNRLQRLKANIMMAIIAGDYTTIEYVLNEVPSQLRYIRMQLSDYNIEFPEYDSIDSAWRSTLRG